MSIKEDKQEKQLKNRKKFKQVEEILKKEFENHPLERGFCYTYWKRKKQLLKEMFNINWQSPAELNPGVRFD